MQNVKKLSLLFSLLIIVKSYKFLLLLKQFNESQQSEFLMIFEVYESDLTHLAELKL